MTGRYEEPETQREQSIVPPGTAGGEAGAGGAQQSGAQQSGSGGQGASPVDGAAAHGKPDYGDSGEASGQYVEPKTTPKTPYPSTAQSGGQPGASPAANSQPANPPSANPQAPAQPPVNPQQASGPHPTPSGPYPGPGGGQSGPFPYPPPAGAQQQFPPPPQGAPQGTPQQQPPYPQNQYQQNPQNPYQQNSQHQQPVDQSLAQDLSSSHLLRQSRKAPQSGWRRALYVASGHAINMGESSADVRRRELIARINQPLHGCYKIAMLSLKGGVGKTTTAATLGSTFSSLRGDRVIGVDANPDRGTLSQKIPLETTATVRHLLRDAQRVRKYSDVRSYTSQGPSRLEILASEQDPAVSEAFSEEDYRRTVTLLEHFYNVLLTDCGTGLMHSAMKGVLDVADSLVIVSSSSIDGARSASATLDWLDAHGYGDLVGRSVAVINSVRPGSGKVDVDKLTAHFGSRCRAVSRIPFDPHLEEGAEVELDQLAAPTRLALLELAATVADDFPQAYGRQRPV